MRIRSIRPEFWSSEDIARLDWDTRLVFIGLWSYVDDNGVGRDIERLIVTDLFPLDEDLTDASRRVHGALQRLAAGGQVTRYTVDGKPYLHVSAFLTHQVINRPSKGRYPLPTSEDAEITPPVTEDSVSAHASAAAREGEKGRRGEVTTPPPADADADADESDPFDEFWQHYPRKLQKQDARKAWKAALKKASASEIIDALKAYPFSDDPQYVKYAATWLNKECWADTPDNVRPIRPGDSTAGRKKQAEVSPGVWHDCHADGAYMGMKTRWVTA